MSQPTKKPTNKYLVWTVEGVLTVIMLGFITAGLLGGANEIGWIHLPEGAANYIGAMLIAYVVVITGTGIHLGVKFAMKKG